MSQPTANAVADVATVAAFSASASRKRSRVLFGGFDGAGANDHDQRSSLAALSTAVDANVQKMAIERRVRRQCGLPPLPPTPAQPGSELSSAVSDCVNRYRLAGYGKIIDGSSAEQTDQKRQPSAPAPVNDAKPAAPEGSLIEVGKGSARERGEGILTKKRSELEIPVPKWHPPWKLATVISSHLGWVRSLAFDPTNEMFASGGADRVIKIFDLAKATVGAEDALKITLTGHISPVRGLAFSDRHPYLFSAGEDKMVKCWDLETNQVIRHYHGHLSGVFALKLHPTLDVLVTGGRDAVARVWDMRMKKQIHCLAGHNHTVGAILTKSTDPQVITGSYDSTVKLWDLVAGKCMTTLTHHKKSVRAMVQPSFENSFLSGAADSLKKWHGRDGRFIKSFTGHKAIVNALALNEDGVLVSAGDNGSLRFWDYETGYCFQSAETIAQPGSLDSENGIFALDFDLTGSRLVTCEADKTIKIWKPDENASELTHPVDLAGWRKKVLAEAKERR